MTMKQLEYFLAVARTLSFSEASKQLFISQPALSRSISSLEEELGVILFFRNKHTVALTPAGLVLATAVPKLRAELERTIGQVQQADEGVRGKLRFNMQNGIPLPPVLSSAFDYFRISLPYIEMQPRCIDSSDVTRAVKEGEADIMFACFADAELAELKNLDSLALCDEPACIAVASGSPLSGTVNVYDLRGEAFIFGCDEGSSRTAFWRSVCSAHGFTPTVKFAGSVSTQSFWVERGYGVAMLPESHRTFESAGIKRLTLDEHYSLKHCIVWNSMNLNPSVDLFIKLIKGDI